MNAGSHTDQAPASQSHKAQPQPTRSSPAQLRACNCLPASLMTAPMPALTVAEITQKATQTAMSMVKLSLSFVAAAVATL